MRSPWLSCLLFLLFAVNTTASPARPFVLSEQQKDYRSELIKKSQEQNIGLEEAWKKRLYYFNGHFGAERSLVDDPQFFFSKRGRSRPNEELVASLKAFLSPGTVKVKLKKEHPRCLFPARWRWLKKRLKVDDSQIFPVDCANIKQFLQFSNYTGATLVFTNYFMDSPASMFGHTFFKMVRKENQGVTRGGLLDDAANYSAMVPIFNALTYPFQGLFGFFHGQFALVPYFQKVQEYNNHEQRDLWEYSLNLTDDEIRDLTLLIYEIGFFYIDYYYLDDNCSFLLLAMLDAVRPSLNLAKPYNLYAIPADTLKSVTNSPGLIKDIQYKPSSFTRYTSRLELLNDKERGLLKKVENRRDIELIKDSNQCSQECQAKVIDTLIEYIDFQEKLVGTLEPIKYKKLRQQALVMRSQNSVPVSSIKQKIPERERPDRGHQSSALGFQAGISENGRALGRFQWKPALHDQFARDIGYSNQMHISFLNVNALWLEEKDKVFFDKVNYLELTSLPRSYLLYNPWAWKFSLSSEAQFIDLNEENFFAKHYLSLGRGKAYRFFSDQVLFYGLLNVQAGRGSRQFLGWYFGLTPELALNYTPSDFFKVSLHYTYNLAWGEEGRFDYDIAELRFTYFPSTNLEFFASTKNEFEALFQHIGMRFYY